MSVLSVGRVAGPGSPTRRLLLELSISWGAKRRLVRGCAEAGERDRGDGSGVSSGLGPTRTPAGARGAAARWDLYVVSMGSGAKRRRGGSEFIVSAACMVQTRDKYQADAGCSQARTR